MTKLNFFPVIFISILSIGLNVNFCLSETTANKNIKNFVFYNVGENDDIISAIKKNMDKNCACVKGKSTSMDLNAFNIENIEIKNIMKEIDQIDNNLRKWGSGTNPESMPIDVLHCESKSPSAFNNWDYFFSNIDGKLLSIIIDIKDYNSVYEQLYSKHGKCIKNGYCVSSENILILLKDNVKVFVLALFGKNIKNHYAVIKKLEAEKNHMQKKSVEEAF